MLSLFSNIQSKVEQLFETPCISEKFAGKFAQNLYSCFQQVIQFKDKGDDH